MKAEEMVAVLSDAARANTFRFERLRECIPLGTVGDEVITAHREDRPERYHYTCVSGRGRGDFIRRLCLTLACIYDRSEAVFLVLSPDPEYAELLNVQNADFTVPYIKTSEDFVLALTEIAELEKMRSFNKRYPKIFLIADGLEKVDGLQDDPASAYRRCLDAVAAGGAEVITGYDIEDGPYHAFPGAFIGIGNCLVNAKGDGVANVRYVNPDSSLSSAREFFYPSEQSLKDAVDVVSGILK